MLRKLVLLGWIVCNKISSERDQYFPSHSTNWPPLAYALGTLSCCESSVSRFGDFWKVLATKFLANDWQLFGLFGKNSLLCKTALATFWTTFGKIWATFYSNIWAHWLWPQKKFYSFGLSWSADCDNFEEIMFDAKEDFSDGESDPKASSGVRRRKIATAVTTSASGCDQKTPTVDKNDDLVSSFVVVQEEEANKTLYLFTRFSRTKVKDFD